jgi:hypothetical protein
MLGPHPGPDRHRPHDETPATSPVRSARSTTAPAGRSGRRAVGGLERHELAGPQTQGRPSGHGDRERCRDRVSDHVDGVATVLEAQRDAEVGVGTDVVGDHPGRPLCGEEQMHAEAATALGHVDERMQELGKLLGQRRELVDHHHESRQRAGDDRR